MAGGLFSRIKNWKPWETFVRSDVNAEFNNIILNMKPEKIDDYALNLAQFQETQAPGAVGSETLPASLAEELQILRYMIQAITGETTQWYAAPDATITEMMTLFQGAVLLPRSRIVSGKIDANRQPMTLDADGTVGTIHLRAASTSLVGYFNGTRVTQTGDLSASGLTTAPSANNTALVNDAALAGAQSTKTQGEKGTYITIDTIGSEISLLNGKIAAFKITHSATDEYFVAEVNTSSNRLENCVRGIFFDSADAAIPRVAVSDNDVITLMKLTWVFAVYASSAVALEVTYNAPHVSYETPLTPASGDYWLDLGNETWKKYNGATWDEKSANFLGICLQDSTGTKAARSADFWKGYSALNTFELTRTGNNTVKSTRRSMVANVYGTIQRFDKAFVTFDMSTDRDSGETDSNSTTYYLYLTDLGQRRISSVAPTDRKADLFGWYHPSKPWRCVGEIANDGSSNFDSTTLDFSQYHGLSLPDSFLRTANYKDSSVTRAKLSAGMGQLNVQIFTVNGTFTPDANTTQVQLFGRGGSGGGAGGSSDAGTTGYGGQGGGGAASAFATVAVTPSSGVTVTIGAAGAVGAKAASGAGTGSDGGDGGDTTFGALATFKGAKGGEAQQAGVSVANFSIAIQGGAGVGGGGKGGVAAAAQAPDGQRSQFALGGAGGGASLQAGGGGGGGDGAGGTGGTAGGGGNGGTGGAGTDGGGGGGGGGSNNGGGGTGGDGGAGTAGKLVVMWWA